jgi:competence protein ComEC
LGLAALGLALGLAWGRHADLWWPGLAGGIAAVLVGLGLTLGRPHPQRLALALGLLGLALGLGRVQGLRGRLDAPTAPDRRGLLLQGRLDADQGVRGPIHAWVLTPLRLRDISHGDDLPLPRGLRLSVAAAASEGWAPGDLVQVQGDLHGFRPPSNPGEFDERGYRLGRGMEAAFGARWDRPTERLAQGAAWGPARLAWGLQQWLLAGLARGLGDRGLALARGIVLGDKSGLEPRDRAQYARSGFADLLVVSGAHFALALGLFLLVARRLTRRRRWQAALGLALGLAYALATGFEAPVQRAFALFAVWLLARLLDLECDAMVSLAFGVCAILLAQPGALWEAGFQLSVGGTLAVLTLSRPLAAALPRAWPPWSRLGLGGLLAGQAALVPLLAWSYHQLCWPQLMASVLGLGIMAALLGLGLPLAVLGGRLPGAALVLGWPLDHLLTGLDRLSAWMAHWPGAAYSTGLPSPGWMGLALAWCLVLLYYRGPWRRLGLGLAWGLGMAWLLLPGLPWMHRHPGETRLWMLDVGQGDALLLEFDDGRTLLVDGGPGQPDAGGWVVVPALRALGIQGLTWAVATHADADHVGGLASVLDQVPCQALLWNGQASPEPFWVAAQEQARQRGVPLRALRSDWADLGDGPWTVLNPRPPVGRRRPPKRLDTNAASVVLRVQDWLLLTGDLPKAGERRLLKAGVVAPVAVLKVGHHGSHGSTSAAWASALRPQQALISCGARNRFGHPSPQALAALGPARLWRTDLQGCVALRWRAGAPLRIQPTFEASPQALAQPRTTRVSPWAGLPEAPPQGQLSPDNAGDFL